MSARDLTAETLPLETFNAAAAHLRRPFTPVAVKFKVQSAWTGENPNATVVTYIDARLVIERLNAVVGECWEDSYVPLPAALECHLTVCEVTRWDVGEAAGIAKEKALRSDALKRAAVKFGVGVHIYAVPTLKLRPGDGLRKVEARGQRKEGYALLEAGIKFCRAGYEKWLKDHGEAAFGPPLDHGDIEGQQGDWEADRGEDVEAVTVEARLLHDDERTKLMQVIRNAGQDVPIMLGTLGVDTADELTTAHAFEAYERLGLEPKATAKAPAAPRKSRRSP